MLGSTLGLDGTVRTVSREVRHTCKLGEHRREAITSANHLLTANCNLTGGLDYVIAFLTNSMTETPQRMMIPVTNVRTEGGPLRRSCPRYTSEDTALQDAMRNQSDFPHVAQTSNGRYNLRTQRSGCQELARTRRVLSILPGEQLRFLFFQ